MSRNSKNLLKDSDLLKLSSAYRSTYLLWRDGYDVKSALQKPTFYRHKKYFLENYDINIAVVRDKESKQESLELETSDVLESLRPFVAKPHLN